MHTIRAEVYAYDKAIFDLVEDVPWCQYPWWQDYQWAWNLEGVRSHLIVEAQDPENGEVCPPKVVTAADIVGAINQLPYAAALWVTGELDSADTVDEVMQVAVHGEVIYA